MSDEEVEQWVGRLLQIGVTVAAIVVLAGGVLYLSHDGAKAVDYHTFGGEPAALKNLWGIVGEAERFNSRGLIQLGLLLLIATPVARVVFTLFAFLRQRDFIFVGVTLFVLSILFYSLFSGE